MPLRILVVEDHAPFRQLICAELQRRAEFQTTEAADGLEAVQLAEQLQPDVILLDLNLPNMHGFEVAGQVRTAEAVQLEQLCSELAPDVDILCAYPVPYAHDDQALTRICAAHTAVSAC